MGNSPDRTLQSQTVLNSGIQEIEQFRKKVSLKLNQIDKTIQLEVNSRDLKFDDFSAQLQQALRIPTDCRMRYYTVNHLTFQNESLQNDFIISNINKQIIMDIIDLGTVAKEVNLSLTVLENDSIRVLQTKAFNFLPLKYILMFYQENTEMLRVFHPEDTMLLDPLDLNKSMNDLKIDGRSVDYNLIIYESQSADYVKVMIRDGKEIFQYDIDRHMRIAQLMEQYNKEKHKNRVLCYQNTKKKIYERYTLQKLANENNQLIMVAIDFDEYFKKRIDQPKTNPLEEIEKVETNFLNMPD